jgi:hypothetical protein
MPVLPCPFPARIASGAVCGLSLYALNPRLEQPAGLRKTALLGRPLAATLSPCFASVGFDLHGKVFRGGLGAASPHGGNAFELRPQGATFLGVAVRVLS